MDDWPGSCIRPIAASVAAAATNNRHHPWISSSILTQIYSYAIMVIVLPPHREGKSADE